MNYLNFIFLIFLFIISSCSPINKNYSVKKNPYSGGTYKVGNTYQVDGKIFTPKESFDYFEKGVASWYGPKFHGKKTANGETFNMNLLTAAHKTLQLPSLVKVTNIENKKSIILRVNDRGPFVKNRIIDVSKKAATILGFHKEGTANVIVEYYGIANIYDKNGKIIRNKKSSNIRDNNKNLYVRIGIFSEFSSLKKIKSQLRGLGEVGIEKIISGYKVSIGPFSNKDYARRIVHSVKKRGFEDAFIEIIK